MPRMTGQQALADMLKGYDVSHVFYVPSVLNPALAAMEQHGIQRVITHGEKAAAYMADGFARATGKPGICLAQDIGTSNLAAGLRDPRMASSPVIAITGGQSEQGRYRHAYQNADDFVAWEPVTKANFAVDTVERLPDLLRQAFRVATTGAPGPVHLELRGNSGQMLDAEAELDTRVEERFTRYPAFRPGPDQEDVARAADMLAEASRPVIVAGGGVISSGAGEEVVKLAERLSIPVATSLNAREIIADDHPLSLGVPGSYARWSANSALQEADLVFFIGSHTGGQVTNTWQHPSTDTTTIQMDIDPEELGRNYPNAVSLLADVRVGVQALIDAVESQPPREQWLKQVQGYVADFWAESESLLTSNESPPRPERIAQEVTEWLPEEAVLVCDTFHAALWTAQMMRMNGRQRYIRCAGSLGWALPGTLGVQAAITDRPVVSFSGDAGFYYHIAELETAMRHGLNAVHVVNNNYSGGVGETSPFDRNVSLAEVAQSMGCFGARAESPDAIRPALDQALQAGRPAVVEIVSDPNIRARRG